MFLIKLLGFCNLKKNIFTKKIPKSWLDGYISENTFVSIYKITKDKLLYVFKENVDKREMYKIFNEVKDNISKFSGFNYEIRVGIPHNLIINKKTKELLGYIIKHNDENVMLKIFDENKYGKYDRPALVHKIWQMYIFSRIYYELEKMNLTLKEFDLNNIICYYNRNLVIVNNLYNYTYISDKNHEEESKKKIIQYIYWYLIDHKKIRIYPQNSLKFSRIFLNLSKIKKHGYKIEDSEVDKEKSKYTDLYNNVHCMTKEIYTIFKDYLDGKYDIKSEQLYKELENLESKITNCQQFHYYNKDYIICPICNEIEWINTKDDSNENQLLKADYNVICTILKNKELNTRFYQNIGNRVFSKENLDFLGVYFETKEYKLNCNNNLNNKNKLLALSELLQVVEILSHNKCYITEENEIVGVSYYVKDKQYFKFVFNNLEKVVSSESKNKALDIVTQFVVKTYKETISESDIPTTFKRLKSHIDKEIESLVTFCDKHNNWTNYYICPICFPEIITTFVFDSKKHKKIAEGGEASIYDIGKFCAKIFNNQVNVKEKISKIKMIKDMNLQDKEKEYNIITPIDYVIDVKSKELCGYTMTKIEGCKPIKLLFDKQFLEDNKFTSMDILQILVNYGTAIEYLHNKDIYISDISGSNILFDINSKKVFIIDIDSIGVVNKFIAKTFTDIFLDPNAYNGEEFYTSKITDLYAFSILSFYSLTLIHPFMGRYKSNPKLNVLERMKERISVLGNYDIVMPPIVQKWDWMKEELINLFKTNFETDERVSILSSLQKHLNEFITKENIKQLVEEVISESMTNNLEKFETETNNKEVEEIEEKIPQITKCDVKNFELKVKKNIQMCNNITITGNTVNYKGKEIDVLNHIITSYTIYYDEAYNQYMIITQENYMLIIRDRKIDKKEKDFKLPSDNCFFYLYSIYYAKDKKICAINIKNKKYKEFDCEIIKENAKIFLDSDGLLILNPSGECYKYG